MAKAFSPDIVPTKDELKQNKTLSTSLNNVMDDIGASLRVRKTKTETATSSEILQTIGYHPWKVYIFGSWYEGTSTIGLGSDIDNAFISRSPHVVTELSRCQCPISYLVIPDNQPGYVKLQLLYKRKPMNKDCHIEINEELYELCPDRNNRLCLMHNFEHRNLQLGDREMVGPALHHSGYGYKSPTDTVYALWCKSWPKCASKWLTRRRRYGWPTKESIHKCKSLGFLMVTACHPHSDDKKCQWRISFSEQERLLVIQFNATQHKCYVLLKIFKAEIIKKQIEEDTLTTYHCKTCMFYVIENTTSEMWSPENLVSCFGMCLRQIHEWVKKSNCPNYFIPEENMFDRITNKALELKLSKLLEFVLNSDIRNVIQSLQTDLIDLRLYTYLNPSSKMSILSEENNSRIASMSVLLTDMMHTRNNILYGTAKNQPRRMDNLDDFMNYLNNVLQIAGAKRISNHSVRETKTASSLIIPFIKLSLLSCDVVKHISETDDILKEFLNKMDWNMLDTINSSAKVKQAAAMHMLKYDTASKEKLLSITTDKFPYCPCKSVLIDVPDSRTLSQATRHRPDITAIELLKDYFQPCIVFLPLEKAITPIALNYEMVRTYGFAMPPLTSDGAYLWWYNWGVVDGRFLVHFLLYLNHKGLRQTVQSAQEITKMTMLLASNNVCHRETCFNLLGWVHKETGDTTRAVHCFVNSLQTNRLRNAAYWHLCFHICERINCYNRAAISPLGIYDILSTKIKEIVTFLLHHIAIFAVLFFALIAFLWWNALK